MHFWHDYLLIWLIIFTVMHFLELPMTSSWIWKDFSGDLSSEISLDLWPEFLGQDSTAEPLNMASLDEKPECGKTQFCIIQDPGKKTEESHKLGSWKTVMQWSKELGCVMP